MVKKSVFMKMYYQFHQIPLQSCNWRGKIETVVATVVIVIANFVITRFIVAFKEEVVQSVIVVAVGSIQIAVRAVRAYRLSVVENL